MPSISRAPSPPPSRLKHRRSITKFAAIRLDLEQEEKVQRAKRRSRRSWRSWRSKKNLIWLPEIKAHIKDRRRRRHLPPWLQLQRCSSVAACGGRGVQLHPPHPLPRPPSSTPAPTPIRPGAHPRPGRRSVLFDVACRCCGWSPLPIEFPHLHLRKIHNINV